MWVQVDHQLTLRNGNPEKTNKMLKITQDKKIETSAKAFCHKTDENCQKKCSFKRRKVQEKK